MGTAIEVSSLRKRYGDTEAVRGISFEVQEGEVFGILGPNGAGKTTTVEILEGYRRPDAGSVHVLGIDPHRAPRKLRQRIGVVLQENGVQPDARARELLELFAGYYPHPKRADEVLDLVGLSHKADRVVKTLSGGERRRLDFALALIGDPDLIFLDEPTTGFDPGARRASWDTIRELCTLGKTILLTTHYMDEAQALADRIVVIANGEIIASGAPASLSGRDVAVSTIRFALPATVAESELPTFHGAEVHVSADGIVEIRSAGATAILNALTSWAIGRGDELSGLTVSRPTLEDVYLQLVAGDTDLARVTG